MPTKENTYYSKTSKEAVIVPEVFNSTENMTITGTPSEVASALNVMGGGKNFDDGATINSKKYETSNNWLSSMDD